MKNIDLNAGGLIGALACGGIATAVIALVDPANPAKGGRGPATVIVLALVGGAFAGNFLWELVFKKPGRGPQGTGAGRPRRRPSAGSAGPRHKGRRTRSAGDDD